MNPHVQVLESYLEYFVESVWEYVSNIIKVFTFLFISNKNFFPHLKVFSFYLRISLIVYSFSFIWTVMYSVMVLVAIQSALFLQSISL